MDDGVLFFQLPQWLGRHFLLVLSLLAGVVTTAILLAVHLFRRHADSYANRSPDALPRWKRLGRFPRLAAFLGNPYLPEHRLMRYLLGGFLLSFLGLYGFVNLFDELQEIEELVTFDRALASSVRAHAFTAAAELFSVVTVLGHRLMLLGLGIAVGVLLFARHRWWMLAAWVGAVGGGSLLNMALKAAVQRARPAGEAATYAEGWSFPSGHAMNSTVAYGMLAYLLVQRFGRHLGPIVAAAVLVILLVGASRIYLGVHYFSDVAAGFLAGAAWLAICVIACELAESRQRGFSRSSRPRP
jgi:membrane-associated phospholipid phosphatase